MINANHTSDSMMPWLPPEGVKLIPEGVELILQVREMTGMTVFYVTEGDTIPFKFPTQRDFIEQSSNPNPKLVSMRDSIINACKDFLAKCDSMGMTPFSMQTLIIIWITGEPAITQLLMKPK